MKQITFLIILFISVNSYSQKNIDYKSGTQTDIISSDFLQLKELNLAVFNSFKNENFSFIEPFYINKEDFNEIYKSKEKLEHNSELITEFKNEFNRTINKGKSLGFVWNRLSITSKNNSGVINSLDLNNHFKFKKAKIDSKNHLLKVYIDFNFIMTFKENDQWNYKKYQIGYSALILTRGYILGSDFNLTEIE